MGQADKAIAFIERLKNPDKTEWAGKPIRLLEWQREYLRQLLDTQTEDGVRRYTQSLLFIPKKNGKTTFLAALAVYFLFSEKHGQIYCAANDKEQASLLYQFAKSMIEQDAWLSHAKRSRVYKAKKQIDCYLSGSTLTVLSSEVFTKNGLNCSIGLYDEVGFAEKSELWDALQSSQISRHQPLMIGMTTAGFSSTSFGYQLYEKAKRIQAQPDAEPSFLPVIYEAPENADPCDVDVWLRCNPSLKELLNKTFIQGEIAKIKSNPTELRRVLRYHLNQWVGAEGKQAWIPLEKWDECHAMDGVTLESLEGKPCVVGIDLASINDLTAMALLFPLPEGRYALLERFYTPSARLAERERRDGGAQYTTWQRGGLLTVTPGDWCDYAAIRADLRELRKKYQVLGVGIDRQYNAGHISQELLDDGLNMIPVGQGNYTMGKAAKELELLVYTKKLVHFGNPILRWNLANCVARVIDDAGNLKPSKVKSTGRIDGIYALLDALAITELGQSTQAKPDIFFF